MDYKILALDLDGTLTNSQKKISDNTKKALIKAQRMGIRLVLASGRPVKGIVPLADELDIKSYGGYILAFNGAKIINYETNEIIMEKTLDGDVKYKVDSLAKKFNVAINTYHGDNVVSETRNKYLDLECKINGMYLKIVDSIVKYVDYPPVKFMITGDSNILENIEPVVLENLKDKANVFRSEPYFLEIVPKNLDKAASLEVLLDKLQLNKSNLIACGDGFNDKSMIEYAGLGVAMENAQQVVKSVADYITLSNDNDGIVKVLEEFIF